MRKKVCNLILIDASGSMNNRVSDVKGNLESLVQDLKANELVDQHLIVCDFSDDFNVLVNTVNIPELETSFITKYKARNSTSLFDAIANSFDLVPKGYDGVFVNIITDGEENSSQVQTKESIKKLIGSKREFNWAITFQGCDEKAIDNAKSLGISNISQFTNSVDGFKKSAKTRSYSYDTFTSSVATGSVVLDGLFNEE